MSRRLRNSLISSTALVLAVIVLFTTITDGLPTAVYADASFRGLDSVVAETQTSASRTYTILEIVPDYALAKLGYLVDGSIPFVDAAGNLSTYDEAILSRSGKEERLAFVASLSDKLSDIVGSDDNKPLSYEEYDESYVEKPDYDKFYTLASAEQIEPGDPEYRLVEDAGGELVLDVIYNPVDEGTGDFSQNILYYTTSGAYTHYYDVSFAALAADADLSDGAYQEESDGTYTYYDAAQIGEITESGADVVWYRPESVSFVKDKSGAYGAALDETMPYIGDDHGNFVTDDASVYRHTYAGETGMYTLVSSEEGLSDAFDIDHPVEVDTIYYTGGYKSRDLLKKYVFDVENESNISIVVQPVTPADLNENTGLLTEASMVCLSGSSTYATGTYEDYGEDNDLSALVAADLYTFAFTDQKPVILDSSIAYSFQSTPAAARSALNGTNIYTLAHVLAVADPGQVSLELNDAGDLAAVDSDGNSLSISDLIGRTYADADNDHFFVNHNVLSVPKEGASYLGTGNPFYLLENLSEIFAGEESGLPTAAETGFGEIDEVMESENLIRITEMRATGLRYEQFDKKISKAVALEYIVSYSYGKQEHTKDKISILDIEPCTLVDSSETGSWNRSGTRDIIEEKLRNLFHETSSGKNDGFNDNPDALDIEVTHMSSAQFAGTHMDLNMYDMIYFGLQNDTSRTTSDISSLYVNDKSLYGLAYTNIGDYKPWTATDYAGAFDVDYNDTANRTGGITGHSVYDGYYTGYLNVRESGNDITRAQIDLVLEYAATGAPIIMAADFLNNKDGVPYKDADDNYMINDFQVDASGNKTTKNGLIDNCTNIYALVDALFNSEVLIDVNDTPDNTGDDLVMKGYSNVMLDAEVETAGSTKRQLFYDYLCLGQPVLSVDTGDYAQKDFTDNNGNVTTEQMAYAEVENDQISFDFGIANEGSISSGVKFKVSLFADTNADGIYSDSEIINARGYKITGQSIDSAKGCYMLRARGSSNKYHLTMNISPEYAGVVPIKLMVSQSTNENRYDYEIVYFHHKPQTVQTIKVLQIRSSISWPTLDMRTSKNSWGGYEGNEIFNKLLPNFEEDFKIEVDMMLGDAFYANCVYDSNGVLVSSPLCDNYQADERVYNYQMVVVGFADSFRVYSDEGSEYNDYTNWRYTVLHDVIEEFITNDNGGSVMFTHDSMSASTNPWHPWFGYYFSKIMGTMAGIDRFGIYKNPWLQAGISGLQADSNEAVDWGSYYSLKDLKGTAGISGSLTKGKMYNAILSYTENQNNYYDVAYKPNSNKKELIPETNGANDFVFDGKGGGDTTTNAKLVNEGQISVYPFNLRDEARANDGLITIAATHGQYNQLNLNPDADGTAPTVWFALAGGSYYRNYEGDARNFYYIYTKGRITYTGAGHSTINSVDEIKLFINTIITSYQTGASTPLVPENPEMELSSDIVYVGMDYLIDQDESSAGKGEIEYAAGRQIDDPDSGEKVHVTVYDSNTNIPDEDKETRVSYYMLCDPAHEGAEQLDEATNTWGYPVGEAEGITDDFTGSFSGGKMEFDVYVPYSLLADDEDFTTLRVKVETKITQTVSYGKANLLADDNTGINTRTEISYVYNEDDINIQRVGLFDLN